MPSPTVDVHVALPAKGDGGDRSRLRVKRHTSRPILTAMHRLLGLSASSACLGLLLSGCGGGHSAHQKGHPPRYHACGRFAFAGERVPTYAHNVSCVVARAVAKRCADRSCFGQFPLPYNGVGEPYLPQAPTFKPLGFECYQAVPPYTAGIPTPQIIPRHEERPFLCWREGSRPGPNPVIFQQLVAYWLSVGGPPPK